MKRNEMKLCKQKRSRLNFRNFMYLGPMGNLALWKPTETSQRFRGGSKAVRANDGDIIDLEGHYASNENVEDPFWRVDLLDFYLVATVEVVCRIDEYFDRNGVMEVRVGKEQNNNFSC